MTTSDVIQSRIDSGSVEMLSDIPVTLTLVEWANLLRSIREHRFTAWNIQLGRLAWMSIASVEAQVLNQTERRI